MKPWVVVVNTLESLSPSQSTVALIQRIARRGHPLALVPGDGLDTNLDGGLVARARFVDPARALDPKHLVAVIRSTPIVPLRLEEAAIVWTRTNPGRGALAVNSLILDQLINAVDAGVPVVNDPRGLLRARSKLYLTRLPPHTRPPTLVTRSLASAQTFLEDLGGRAVIKPVMGSQGRDVFVVRGADDPNLKQILQVVFRQGFAIVQGFVPEAVEGDTRILLLDGELMETNGHVAAVRRIPTGSDFRSNVHVGGRPAPAEIDDDLRELVDTVGPQLRHDGLFLVGLDVIGGTIVEVNAFSPGGFADILQFTHHDFLEDVVSAAEHRART